MRIHVRARLEDLQTHRDCRREARRLVPAALRAIGEAIAYERAPPELTEIEKLFLIGAAGRNFVQRATDAFRRQLEQKLFEQLWWAAPFPSFDRSVLRA